MVQKDFQSSQAFGEDIIADEADIMHDETSTPTLPSKNGNTTLLIIILFGLFILNRKKK